MFRSKDAIIEEFHRIKDEGWIPSVKRKGNDAGPGNTLEELLGIEENNLPIPNAGEWELKAQRRGSQSLVTLFHCEPSPRAVRYVPQILLPLYGWKHKKAGEKYPDDEMSFRSTTYANRYTDRGFRIIMNDDDRKIEFSFNANQSNDRHGEWLSSVEERVGNLADLNPRPYWGYDDIYAKARSKIYNTFFSLCNHKIEENREFFHFNEFYELSEFTQNKFLNCVREGLIAVDFDARTGHNHGTKFRMQSNAFPELFERVRSIFPQRLEGYF